MFNLFGSIFFGSKNVDTQSTETQTNEINGPVVEDRSQINASIQNDNHVNDVSITNEDWDIVDRSEEADKCESQDSKEIGVNTSIYEKPEPNPDDKAGQESIFDRPEDDNDIILGSFFEKNEKSNDNEDRYKTQGLPDDDEEITDEVVAVVRNKDWLITPLPCLTSITASQRSISENAELENLLIEHPSMSVFVSATSTSIIEIDESNDTVMQSAIKNQSEKRKGAEMQVDSQNSTLKRKGKKGKRSNNTVSNKENVRALLFNENKKSCEQAKKLDALLLNGKQLKRNNKNSKWNNVNMNKRKYHQMQQPAFFNNNL
ncbi:unnamed protein product [Brachionus calyciflorus]|uniref:Uncharacterized protein n=1 Tax=Brachionus calyciflorus TaxID=104777 RepID=A0A813QRM3_9BILA|nr:unnamed protein product [Brachionus calyciflorus]